MTIFSVILDFFFLCMCVCVYIQTYIYVYINVYFVFSMKCLYIYIDYYTKAAIQKLHGKHISNIYSTYIHTKKK